jgi:site-specific recombinase XerD
MFRYRAGVAYKAAGLDRPKHPWHCLRHTFCSLLAEAGVPVTAIRELAGHSDLKITLRYVHTLPESLQAAIDRLQIHASIAQAPAEAPAGGRDSGG